MDFADRRRDKDTAEKIDEAQRIFRAFGSGVAQEYLKLRGIGDDVVERVLTEKQVRMHHDE
ncbi:MAG: hypothetical protein V4463_13195 [Pseudomonadota bacterium]